MKLITFSFLLFFGTFGKVLIAQDSIIINKYHSIYLEGNGFASNPYQTVYHSDYYADPKDQFNLFSYGFGLNFSIITTQNFSFNWDFSYHINLIKDNVKLDPKPQDVYVTSVNIQNLKKFRTGPTFFIGKIHQLELGLNVERSMLKETIIYNTFPSYNGWQGHEIIEGRLNLGYRYIHPNGLTLRAGASYNTDLSLYYHNLGGFLSLGYSLKRVLKVPPKIKENQFFVINAMGYLLDLQSNIIGAGFGFEHFFHNTNRLNIGYSLLVKGGLGFYGSLPVNVIPSGVLLLGLKEKSKLDFELGANIPLIDIEKAIFPQFVNIGAGYRYIDKGISFRFGIATTGIIRLSLGVVVGRDKKAN